MNNSRTLSLESMAIPPASDAELRFRITDYSYAPVSETGAIAYLRAWRSDSQSRPLTIARTRSGGATLDAACQLNNELALRTHLDDGWAMKPSGSVIGASSVVLLYDDADILALEKLAPNALTVPCFIKLAQKLAHVLEHMHAAGLIHRNISPACFFVGIDQGNSADPEFKVKIGGFGLASMKATDATHENATALLRGNLAYMSPEHSGRTQRPIDARSDLYSLGVIFYRLLTGHLPFGISDVDSDAAEWTHFHIASETVAPHLRSDAIPEVLSRMTMRLLEKNPDRRYQSAAELRTDIERCTLVLYMASEAGLGSGVLSAPTVIPALAPAFLSRHGANPQPALAVLPVLPATATYPQRLRQAILYYHAGAHAQAAACMEIMAGSAERQTHASEFDFFSALILAATVPATPHDSLLQTLRRHCENICGRSNADSSVHAVQTLILLGEIARLDSNISTALRHYEQALHRADKDQLWHYAALAHELAARVSQQEGLLTSLAAHLKSACAAYKKWGAPGLALQLQGRYQESTAAQADNRSDAGISRTTNTTDTVDTADETGGIRDLESVIRAARALSEEIRLDKLIHTIMSVALEHVGAERGLLIRVEEQYPTIEACARTTTSGITVDLLHAPVTDDDLPMTMLLQAISSRSQVSVSNARFNEAHAEGYSAVCVPMLKQSRVVGALYLENRVLPDAFTIEHTQILQLLAAQAAISLETARLYAALLAENEQRTAAEMALRASQSSLVLGEQFNHIGSMRYQLEEGLMFCSAELCRIYGLEPGKEIITYEEFSALLHPDDRTSVLDTVETAVAVAGTIRVEHRICRKTGEIRYISGIGKPFYIDGKLAEYVGTATDITSRRQAEDALRVAQADLARVSRATTVGQLTASIAHEINQPLMSIVSNAGASLRWLNRDPMHVENARIGLRDIVTEGQRAGDMIQSLQRLTRNTEPVFERINLNAAIRHILAISRSEMERREVSLTLALTQENLHVRGDFVQLQQVLLNLVINAIEAMATIETRPRTLSISSAGIDDARIAVVVEDTGEGISADATTRVFDAFYTTKKNGMGMGLAICRSIIENHSGKLQAAIRQPYGSKFWFELPLIP